MGIVDDLTVLVEIVKAGGMAAASRSTGVSKSSLSRRMAELERELGVHLLNRGPRQFTPTDIGALICARSERIAEELEAIRALAQNATTKPTGNLKISCPAVLAERFVAGYACRFATEHPDVRFTFDTSWGSFEPELGPYDLTIQPSHDDMLADSELIRHRLVTAPYKLVASPTFILSRGPIKHLDDLARCPGIGWAADGMTSRWPLRSHEGQNAEIAIDLRFHANNLNIIKVAALNGLGIARLPLGLCEEELKSGFLVEPLAGWAPPSVTLYGLYPTRRSLSFAGRLFLGGLARQLHDDLIARKT